jgi:DNA replication protein DnaC
MKNSIRQEAALVYQKRRQDNEERSLQKIRLIYKQHPKLEQIDHKIILENIRIASKIVTDGKERISSEKKDALISERGEYLRKNQIPKDFDQPIYNCKQCKDTGMVSEPDLHHCDCYQQTISPILLKHSNMGNISEYSFDCFSLSLFSDQPSPNRYGSEISPRKQMEGIHAMTRKFIINGASKETKNLFFIGKPGTGKTFLSACVANEWIRFGRSVLYLSSPELFDQLSVHRIMENTYTPDPERWEKSRLQYEHIMHCELLILDDFGTEVAGANRQPDLLAVLNTRLDAGRKMIISTNLDIKNIYEIYDERILSRIYGHFTVLKFYGEDIRHLNR